jgi:hypothetical protein
MLKLALTALAAAAATVAAVAATGLGAAAPRALNMKINQVIYLKSDNFHCQALAKAQVACGSNTLPNSIQVYFTPHQVVVLQFDKSGKKAKPIYATKR